MKTASTALQTLLATRNFQYVDLYTFTLSGGGVVRLCGGNALQGAGNQIVAVKDMSGNVYPRGCPIEDGGVKAKIGLDAQPLQITIYGDNTTLFSGTGLQQFMRANGLNAAAISVDRAYAPSWAAMAANGPTGTINRFKGMFGAVTSMTRTSVQIDAYPFTYLLNSNMPTNVFQAGCLHTLFDAGCTLSRTAFATSAAAEASSTTVFVTSNLTRPAGYFTLGKIVFTSGANAGQQRTVKSHDGSGNLTLVLPLPAAPAAGDTFTAYPGCDLSEGTCSSKFDNLQHFRGFPFTPPPEASL